jgi:hypothetical protein
VLRNKVEKLKNSEKGEKNSLQLCDQASAQEPIPGLIEVYVLELRMKYIA